MWNLALLWDDDVLILCSREMRECDFMLTRSDTGAGQPVALIMTHNVMAAALAFKFV